MKEWRENKFEEKIEEIIYSKPEVKSMRESDIAYE